jgi:hypothetical protein
MDKVTKKVVGGGSMGGKNGMKIYKSLRSLFDKKGTLLHNNIGCVTARDPFDMLFLRISSLRFGFHTL